MTLMHSLQGASLLVIFGTLLNNLQETRPLITPAGRNRCVDTYESSLPVARSCCCNMALLLWWFAALERMVRKVQICLESQKGLPSLSILMA